MSFRLRFAAVLLSALATPSSGQEEVDSLLQKLGSDKLEEREAASQELIRRGKPVRSSLERAAKNADPEFAARARLVLDEIDHSLDLAAEMLGRLGVEEKDSHQRFLWRAQTWIERASARRTWDQIPGCLERQKIGVTAVSGGSAIVTHRFLVKQDAIATPQAQKMDLLLEFEVMKVPELGKRTVALVRRSSALLRASIRMPLRQAVAEPRFPDDSAIQKSLSLSNGDRMRAEYPDLEEVEMTFGLIPDKNRQAQSVPSGFHLRFNFADRLDGKTDSAYQCLTASSGLEPLRALSGERLDPHHVAKDTVDAPTPDSAGSKSLIGHGLKRLDLPVPRDPTFGPVPEREIVPEAWSLPDLEALPDTIRALRIRGSFLSDEEMKGLERFRRLESLQFRHGEVGREVIPPKVTDRGIQRLRDLRNLNRLELLDAGLLTDEGLRQIGALKALAALKLRFCAQVTDQGLQALSGLAELEDLEFMSDARITDTGLAALAKLPKLRSVRLYGLKGITSAGWAALAKAPALRELDVRACTLDDDGLAEFGRIKDLEFLAYFQWAKSEGNVTDPGILRLQGLTNLRRLILNNTKVTREGLQALQGRLPGRYVSH